KESNYLIVKTDLLRVSVSPGQVLLRPMVDFAPPALYSTAHEENSVCPDLRGPVAGRDHRRRGAEPATLAPAGRDSSRFGNSGNNGAWKRCAFSGAHPCRCI